MIKTVEEAVQFCKDKGIEIKGTLRYDPYIGWVDDSIEHENGYCMLCDLNVENNLCCTCIHYPCNCLDDIVQRAENVI